MSAHDRSDPILCRPMSVFDVASWESRNYADLDSTMSVSCDKPIKREKTKTSRRSRKQNTLQLGPRRIFKPSKATAIAEKVVAKWITKDIVYNADWARTAAKAISGDVENIVTKLPFDRYKFVVQVTIGQKPAEVRCCSRILSDQLTDKFSEFIFQNETLWCVVLTFAVYYE